MGVGEFGAALRQALHGTGQSGQVGFQALLMSLLEPFAT